MQDYIVRATAAGAQIRAFAATTRELTEIARQHHNTSPVTTAALGRLLTAGAMMGSMMKGEKDLLTLQITGDGPMGGITVTADSKANVKGYVKNPDVINPPNYLGHFDIGGALGYGTLTVIKDMGLKEPYSGQVELVTGEIAEDLTYYFATSEQVPSSVGLGVLMNKDNTVKRAGGFIIQLMPFAGDELLEKLEKKLTEVKSVTDLLDREMSPEDILEYLLGDFGLEITDTVPANFLCNCSKERIGRVLATLKKSDLEELIKEGQPIEIRCNFCNTAYQFTVEDLKKVHR